jgi:hypothetical protein
MIPLFNRTTRTLAGAPSSFCEGMRTIEQLPLVTAETLELLQDLTSRVGGYQQLCRVQRASCRSVA